MSVEHGIIALLGANSGVTDIVGDRITPGLLGNPDLAYPHVAVELQATDDHHTTDAVATLSRSLVTCYCVAKTINGAIALADAVNSAINGYNGGGALVTVTDGDDVDIASIRRFNMQNSPSQLGTRTYRRAVSFSVWSRGT